MREPSQPSKTPPRGEVPACRVEAAGVDGKVFFCLMDEPENCRHAVRFGLSFICLDARAPLPHGKSQPPQFEGKAAAVKAVPPRQNSSGSGGASGFSGPKLFR